MNIDLTKFSRKLNLVPHISHIGLFKVDYQNKNALPQTLQFCFRLSGAEPLRCRIGGEVQTLSYPHLFVKYPQRAIHPANNVEFFGFYFSYQPGMEKFFCRSGMSESLEYYPFDPLKVIPDLFEKLKIWERDLYLDGTADQIDMACFQLASAAILASQTNEKREDPEKIRLKRIASELRMNLHLPVDFAEVARHGGFSRVRFFRLWKELFGSPPQEWLLNLKFQEARRLLEDTGMSINEISELLGYRETANFCAAFRTRYGITPLKFRKTR